MSKFLRSKQVLVLKITRGCFKTKERKEKLSFKVKSVVMQNKEKISETVLVVMINEAYFK